MYNARVGEKTNFYFAQRDEDTVLEKMELTNKLYRAMKNSW